jgi:hypothetical protein
VWTERIKKVVIDEIVWSLDDEVEAVRPEVDVRRG